MMYDTDQYSVIYILIHCGLCVCVCVCGGVFPYDALYGLFWWDCALRVYRISYLG